MTISAGLQAVVASTQDKFVFEKDGVILQFEKNLVEFYKNVEKPNWNSSFNLVDSLAVSCLSLAALAKTS
jgi:hypothetical protein